MHITVYTLIFSSCFLKDAGCDTPQVTRYYFLGGILRVNFKLVASSS